MPLRFINVDLEIEASNPLDYLCLELSSLGVHHLYSGPSGRGYLAKLECADGGDTCEPDSILVKFCEAIERLDERATKEWKNAKFRRFDLGYEAVDSDQTWQSALRHPTLSRIVALGASLHFTAYPKDQSEQASAGNP